MKYEIMLSILFDLLSKKSVSAKYLSQKHKVCVRSIYRYISTIEMAGIPIFSTRGSNGGFSIMDTFKLPATFMTPTEYDKTISTLSAFVENIQDKTLISVIDKLKANSKNSAKDFSIKSDNLVIDGSHWGDTRTYQAKLRLIGEAIDSCEKIEIWYHDRKGNVTQRKVQPYLLMFKQGLWYVFAFCELRNTFRIFKIGRIERATKTVDKFTRTEYKDELENLNFWQDSPNVCDVTLEVNANILSDVEEWLGIENVKNINGKRIAEVSLPVDSGLVSKIMSFGDGIKVISPPELTENIKNSAIELLKLYS